MKPAVLTDAQKKRLIVAYKDGATLRDLCARFHISAPTAKDILAAAGVQVDTHRRVSWGKVVA